MSRAGWWALSFFLILLTACVFPLLPEFVFDLAFGWVGYLVGVLPRVRPSPVGVASGVICLALFTGGAHVFLRWLFGEVRGPQSSPWQVRWTGMLVAAIALMFTAGMAATGVVHQVGWIVNSPEPIISGGGASKAARRAQSVNNLKQTGLALHNFHNAQGAFPPGLTLDDFGVPLHGWQALIAPFSEFPKADRIDLSRPWDDPVNLLVFREEVNQYLIPGVTATRAASGLALSHFEGNRRVLGGTRRLRMSAVTDGTQFTVLAGEVAGGYRPWGQPGTGRDPADGINRAADRGFGGPFSGGANLLMIDGTVRFVKDSVAPRILNAIATPAGDEVVSDDNF